MKFTRTHLLCLMALAGALPLSGALLSQFGFGYAPCHLCLLQRYPYAAVLAFTLLAVLFKRHTRWFAYGAALALLITAGIGLFHAGVEAGWWRYESACTTHGGGASIEELKRAIAGAPLVSCDQAMLFVLGLSMAAWNAIAGTVLAIMVMLGVRRTL